MRGQNTDDIGQLTGRTKVWSVVFAEPRSMVERVFGSGLSDQSFKGLAIDSDWVSAYVDQGWFGVMLDAALVLVLLMMATLHERGPQRAMALFLVVYALVASVTETTLVSPTPYLLGWRWRLRFYPVSPPGGWGERGLVCGVARANGSGRRSACWCALQNQGRAVVVEGLGDPSASTGSHSRRHRVARRAAQPQPARPAQHGPADENPAQDVGEPVSRAQKERDHHHRARDRDQRPRQPGPDPRPAADQERDRSLADHQCHHVTRGVGPAGARHVLVGVGAVDEYLGQEGCPGRDDCHDSGEHERSWRPDPDCQNHADDRQDDEHVGRLQQVHHRAGGGLGAAPFVIGTPQVPGSDIEVIGAPGGDEDREHDEPGGACDGDTGGTLP